MSLVNLFMTICFLASGLIAAIAMNRAFLHAPVLWRLGLALWGCVSMWSAYTCAATGVSIEPVAAIRSAFWAVIGICMLAFEADIAKTFARRRKSHAGI